MSSLLLTLGCCAFGGRLLWLVHRRRAEALQGAAAPLSNPFTYVGALGTAVFLPVLVFISTVH